MREVRRTVTGVGADGKPGVIFEGDSPHTTELPIPGFFLTDIWTTDAMPVDNSGTHDGADGQLQVEPKPNGTLFRIIEFPPDSTWVGKGDVEQALASVGAAGGDSPDGLMWHQTNTIDYITIVEGEIHQVFEGGDVRIGAGETLVVRGIPHAWSNRTDKRCVMACVSVNARPL